MSIVSYAQNFEDVMLWRALGHVAEGFYIDVGAQHPVIDSVSKAFYEHGWRGIHVEPTTTYATLLRQDRPDETVLQAALTHTHGTLTFYEIPETGLSTADPAIAERHKQQGFEIRETTVPCLTLADVFERAGTRDIHWLKIDVEGFERQVLDGWGLSPARPWVVIVESTLPLTTIESHANWEPLLLDRDYEHVYFDGLNRYYVSTGHPELRDAFRAGPNVFDGFALHGTASAPFCHLIQERHKAEFADTQTKLDQARHGAQQEITRLTEVLATQQELHAKQEQALEEQLQAASDAVRQLESGLVDQSRASSEREQSLERGHATRVESFIQQLQGSQTELRQLTQEGAARERDLTQQTAQIRREVEGLLRTLAQREKEFSQELMQTHQHAEEALADQLQASQAELRRLAQEAIERDRVLTQQNLQVRQEMEALLRSLAQREREFARELLQIQREAEQASAEQARVHAEQEQTLRHEQAEREQALTEQIDQLGLEVKELLHSLAQRECEFAHELQQTHRDAEQAASEQARVHAEHEQALAQQLLTAHGELRSAEARSHDRERQLGLDISSKQAELIQLTQAHAALDRVHAEHEQALAQQLLAAHGELRSAEARSHDRERQLGLDISSKQAELIQLMQAHAALEAQLREQMAAERHTTLLLQASLDAIHASFTWRITAPLRWIGSLFSTPSPVPQAQAAPIFSSAAPQSPAPACIAPGPTSPLTQPHPSETRISALAIDPPMNRPSTAHTLDELLSYHDQDFVFSAYQTLLGREPDPEGLQYYLSRLRKGISKGQTVAQLALSAECKARNVQLPGLKALIRRRQWCRTLIIGPAIQHFITDEGGALPKKLRIIENQISQLREENQQRFNKIDLTLAELHHVFMQQARSINATIESPAFVAPEVAAPSFSQTPEPEGLKELSASAKNIYFQLKAATATHAGSMA